MPSHRVSRRLQFFALCTAVAAAAACRGSPPGPSSLSSLAFATQPSTAVTGEAIEPPVEVRLRDASGEPIGGTVTIALDPNPCGWQLSGQLTLRAPEGTAIFDDLALDRVGRGYTLRASSDGLSALSAPFDVRSAIVTEQVFLENLLCLKPSPQNDGESLTHVPEDDTFWIADDNQNSIFQVDRSTGSFISQITVSEILETLPDAGQCDDGDGDPNTVCSYVEEVELSGYDAADRALYLINTVNTSPPDKPAIFRLTKGGCAGCFTPESWQPLPEGHAYRSIIAVGNQLYLAIKRRIYAYDYDTNQIANVDANGDSLPPTYTTPSSVVDLSFDGTFMWILTDDRNLLQVEWATRTELQSIDLDPFNFSLPRGMEMVNDTIYVLEGDHPNPIYVLSQR